MTRSYVDVSKFRSPYNYPTLTLTGLGAENELKRTWPKGRSYMDTSRFRAPYLDYQFQDNQLFGLGAPAPLDQQALPENLQAYLRTGAPMSTLRRDLGSALAQVPRLAWGLGAAVAGFVAYKAWKAT
jgi:hypothetical protein